MDGIRYETATEAERQFRAEAAAAAERRVVDGAQYWAGTPPPELTVGYLTTTVGAMGAGYALNLLLGQRSYHITDFNWISAAHVSASSRTNVHLAPIMHVNEQSAGMTKRDRTEADPIHCTGLEP